MRGRNLLPLLVLLVAGRFEPKLSAQPLTTPMNVVPDCLIFFDFSADASSASFDNRFLGCKTWYVAYTSTGFPAITLTFQSAPDNLGVPGAWVAFAGAVSEGVNPNVALTQASTVMYGYYPWQRITLSGSVAGAGRRLRGTFYGYRQTPVATVIFPALAAVLANQGAAAAAAGRWPVYLSDGANPQGLVANPFYTRLSDGANPVGTTANPLATGNEYYLGAGATWTPAPACTSRAAITLVGAGTTEIIAASGATSIRVCHLSLSAAGATNITLVQGTGVNCVTGPANVTGTYQNVLSMALPFEGRSLVTAGASQALCITSSAGVNAGGFVTYTQY
jgi:hypothetical protein